jgi:hypothetical protein
MRTQEAIHAINDAIWRPGVQVRATPYQPLGYELPGYTSLIMVEVIFDTYDSSYVNDAGDYTRKAKIAPEGLVDVRELTEETLLYRVLQMVGEAQEHEDREFLRVRRNGQWTAPFHPHNRDGQQLWDSQGRKSARDVYAGR